jgi:hypothetical protein
MTPEQIILGITLFIAIVAFIVAFLAEFKKDPVVVVPTTVRTANGFQGTISGHEIVLGTSVDGLLDGSAGKLTKASDKVPLDGSAPMTGDLNLESHAISGVTNIGVTNINSLPVSTLVRTATSGTTNRVVTYDSGNNIKDSGTLISDLVPYTGATANLNLGTNGCLVRGSFPVAISRYSQHLLNDGFSFTTSELSVLPTAGQFVGSNVFPANTTTPGMTIRISHKWHLSIFTTNTTITIRVYTNGLLMLTTLVPNFGNNSSAPQFFLEHSLQLRDTGMFCCCTIFKPPQLTDDFSSLWDPTVSNTITVTGQFNDIDGIVVIAGTDMIVTYQ